MTRIAYIDCVAGAAGDMLLGALLDLGGNTDVLAELPERLGLDGVAVEIEQVQRHGIRARHVSVTERDTGPHRHWRELHEQVLGASLPASVRERSRQVLERLAKAEARVHGVAVADVHFHELGAADTLIDVCGVVSMVEELGIEQLACSPLPLGRGTTTAAHGTLPLPAPATLELLVGVPVTGVDLEAELVTPTGAALITGLCNSFGDLPPLTLQAVGHGAGARDLRALPNMVRILVGDGQPGPGGEVVCLETNLDDLAPELVPDAAERCWEAGALDVWTTPALMKKGRPGFVLCALARPADQAAVATAMLGHTTALGVRLSRLHRYELDRELRHVHVAGGTVAVKLGIRDGQIVNIAPEHDDCAALARSTGQPVAKVWAAAIAALQEPT